MKGRHTYDNINNSIDEFNAALDARYEFLGRGFQAMASMALKKRYKVWTSHFFLLLTRFPHAEKKD